MIKGAATHPFSFVIFLFPMKMRLGTLLAILALVFTGLSFLAPTPAAAAAKDACSLMTAADAQAVLGEPTGAGKSEPRSFNGAEGTVCKFRSAQGNGMKTKSVSLNIQYSNSDISSNDNGMMENMKSAGYKDAHAVSGVGDAAVWGTTSMMGKPTGELTVRKGKTVTVIILIIGLDDATALDRAKALAAKVLPQA